MHVGCVKG
jgi:hypothetical protein